MIVSRIDGGLGNQMFQYAFGSYLAKQHQCPLRLDLNSYAGGPQHGYLLDRFQISAAELAPDQQHLIPARYRSQRASGVGRVLSSLGLSTLGLGRSLARQKEQGFGFKPAYLQTPAGRYLAGYWQSEKFFPGMRSQLLDEFSLRQPLTAASQQVAERISRPGSIALHIRRGDYLSNPDAARIYARLDLDYYRSSVLDFARHTPGLEVFVFSNDVAWCRQELQLPCPMHFVDHNTADTAHEDMMLISQAQAVVIANSTFSWWAAWLNQRSDRRVYAPDRWFQPGTMDGSHILCDSWLQMPTATKQAA